MTKPSIFILTSTIVISQLLAACCCGSAPQGAEPAGPVIVPKSVKVYPGATNIEREFAGRVTRQMEVPTTPTKVKKYYDRTLKKHWKPVDNQWNTRTKFKGTRFEYRRYQSRTTRAVILIDVANAGKGKKPTGVELKYCPKGDFLCGPSDRLSVYDRKRAGQSGREVLRAVRKDLRDPLDNRDK